MKWWPPAVWVLVYVGSLLLLEGYDGSHFNPLALAFGIALILGAFALSCYLAFGRRRDRPAPRGLAWLIPATAAFYLLCAIFGLFAGGTYAIVALVAGVIPLTAATLIVATVRAKTSAEGREVRDAAAGDHRDPQPGMGADDSTPLGDTPEHSAPERAATPDRLPPKRR
jgi:peptidoglycan/LPS O-acetylase OafA/YrhL